MDGQAIHSLYLSILGQAISGQATHSRTSLTYLDKLCIIGQAWLFLDKLYIFGQAILQGQAIYFIILQYTTF